MPTGEFKREQFVIEDDTWSDSIIPDTGQRNDSGVDRKRLAALGSLHPIVVSTESRESAR
jgi:hypothetical protein